MPHTILVKLSLHSPIYTLQLTKINWPGIQPSKQTTNRIIPSYEKPSGHTTACPVPLRHLKIPNAHFWTLSQSTWNIFQSPLEPVVCHHQKTLHHLPLFSASSPKLLALTQPELTPEDFTFPVFFSSRNYFFFLPCPTWYWISRASESHLDHFPSLLPEQKMTSPLRLLPISSSPAPLCIDQVDFKYCLAILSVLQLSIYIPTLQKTF